MKMIAKKKVPKKKKAAVKAKTRKAVHEKNEKRGY
jgi:hypothetical protein